MRKYSIYLRPKIGFYFFRSSHTTKSGAAINTEEYVPKNIPRNITNARFCVDCGPQITSARRARRTVTEVIMDRVIVSEILFPTTLANDSTNLFSSFVRRRSRMRSNTTIVSLTDTPRIVRSPTTKSVSTGIPKNAKIPAGIMTSWIKTNTAKNPYTQDETRLPCSR